MATDLEALTDTLANELADRVAIQDEQTATIGALRDEIGRLKRSLRKKKDIAARADEEVDDKDSALQCAERELLRQSGTLTRHASYIRELQHHIELLAASLADSERRHDDDLRRLADYQKTLRIHRIRDAIADADTPTLVNPFDWPSDTGTVVGCDVVRRSALSLFREGVNDKLKVNAVMMSACSQWIIGQSNRRRRPEDELTLRGNVDGGCGGQSSGNGLELLIALLHLCAGHDIIQCGGGNNDGGIDIVVENRHTTKEHTQVIVSDDDDDDDDDMKNAYEDETIRERLLIQCKHYEKTTIELDSVKALPFTMYHQSLKDGSYHNCLFVTTGHVTSGMHGIADAVSQHRINGQKYWMEIWSETDIVDRMSAHLDKLERLIPRMLTEAALRVADWRTAVPSRTPSARRNTPLNAHKLPKGHH